MKQIMQRLGSYMTVTSEGLFQKHCHLQRRRRSSEFGFAHGLKPAAAAAELHVLEPEEAAAVV